MLRLSEAEKARTGTTRRSTTAANRVAHKDGPWAPGGPEPSLPLPARQQGVRQRLENRKVSSAAGGNEKRIPQRPVRGREPSPPWLKAKVPTPLELWLSSGLRRGEMSTHQTKPYRSLWGHSLTRSADPTRRSPPSATPRGASRVWARPTGFTATRDRECAQPIPSRQEKRDGASARPPRERSLCSLCTSKMAMSLAPAPPASHLHQRTRRVVCAASGRADQARRR